jgi:hypothetical protein
MWRTTALAAGFFSLGFLAGVLVAPRLHRAPATEPAPVVVDEQRVPVLAEAHARVLEAHPPKAAAAKIPTFKSAAPVAGPDFVSVQTLPAPVRDVVMRLVADHPVKGLAAEVREHKGQPFYKVQYELDGTKREFFFDQRGTLMQSETQLAMNEIPARVQEAIAQALPGSGLLKAKKLEGSWFPVPLYEVDVRGDGNRREVQVTETGEIARIKVK